MELIFVGMVGDAKETGRGRVEMEMKSRLKVPLVCAFRIQGLPVSLSRTWGYAVDYSRPNIS